MDTTSSRLRATTKKVSGKPRASSSAGACLLLGGITISCHCIISSSCRVLLRDFPPPAVFSSPPREVRVHRRFYSLLSLPLRLRVHCMGRPPARNHPHTSLLTYTRPPPHTTSAVTSSPTLPHTWPRAGGGDHPQERHHQPAHHHCCARPHRRRPCVLCICMRVWGQQDASVATLLARQYVIKGSDLSPCLPSCMWLYLLDEVERSPLAMRGGSVVINGCISSMAGCSEYPKRGKPSTYLLNVMITRVDC